MSWKRGSSHIAFNQQGDFLISSAAKEGKSGSINIISNQNREEYGIVLHSKDFSDATSEAYSFDPGVLRQYSSPSGNLTGLCFSARLPSSNATLWM